MKFSLIVSTIGRDQDLRCLLASLVAQSRQDFEVLVVDQSQGATIAEVVIEFSDRLTIRHLPMEGRGLSRGRNFGWAQAEGEFLNFPDDDCTWPPELLAEVAARFEARPDLDILMARVDSMSRPQDPGGPVQRGNMFRSAVEIGLFARRQRLGDLRYDEQMGVGAGTPWGADEGPDLMLHALDRGLSIEYFPELTIHHPDPLAAPPEQLLARTLAYSRGRGYLLRKHRFSRFFVLNTLLRSLGGAILMLSCGRWTKARKHWLAFRGKWIGYFGGRAAKPDVREPSVAESGSTRQSAQSPMCAASGMKPNAPRLPSSTSPQRR